MRSSDAFYRFPKDTKADYERRLNAAASWRWIIMDVICANRGKIYGRSATSGYQAYIEDERGLTRFYYAERKTRVRFPKMVVEYKISATVLQKQQIGLTMS